MRRFLHHFNPWHWPGWYAVNFWFLFAGLLVALVLRNSSVQTALHFFYASHLWYSVKSCFKKSKPNQAVVRFILHKRFGKWLLRKWLTFWQNTKVERYPAYAWVFAFIAIFIVFFRYAAWMEMPRNYLLFYWKYPRQFIYHSVYEPFYLGPLVEFNISGTITWRLFIVPATGLLLIVWLLRIASKSKKKRRTT